MAKRKPRSDKPLRVDLHKIFAPDTVIGPDNSEMFVGRTDLLSGLAKALRQPGLSVVIFGERAAGKTSVAHVLKLAVEGRLKKSYPGGKLKIERSDANRLRCVWQGVDEGIACVEDALHRMLSPYGTDPYSFARRFPKAALAVEKEFNQIDPLKVAEPVEGVPRRLNASQKLVHRLFQRVEEEIRDKHPGEAPLFFIDELDQMHDRRGLGKLLKNRSSSFVLIGIGNTRGELVEDHGSADRKLAGEFEVPRLSRPEVGEVFAQATKRAKKQKLAVEFTDGFVDSVYADSAGIPGLCQRLGAAAIQRFEDQLAGGAAIELDEKEFLKIVSRTDNRFARDTISADRIDRALSRGDLRWQILRELAGLGGPDWRSIDDVEKGLKDTVIVHLDRFLKELAEDEVLELDNEPRRLRFKSSAIWAEVRRRLRIGWKPNQS